MKIIVAMLVALGIASCSEGPVAGDEAIMIQEESIPALISKAESGDLAAANALAVYYGAAGEPAEGHKWLLFAGRRGDCNALRVLWSDNRYLENPNLELAAEVEAIAAPISCNLE